MMLAMCDRVKVGCRAWLKSVTPAPGRFAGTPLALLFLQVAGQIGQDRDLAVRPQFPNARHPVLGLVVVSVLQHEQGFAPDRDSGWSPGPFRLQDGFDFARPGNLHDTTAAGDGRVDRFPLRDV